MLSVRQSGNRLDLKSIIGKVRRRWRLKILMRGVAAVAAVGFAVFLFTAFGMDFFRFTGSSVLVFRVIAYAALAAAAVWFLVIPLAKRVTDEQVALYIEEHEPSLQQTLLSAVELDRVAVAADSSTPLTSRLVEQAVQSCRQIDNGTRIEQPSFRRSSGTLAGVVAAGALIGFMNPGFLRNGAPFLLNPFGGGGFENPYAISVTPGDTLLARGADLAIVSNLYNFEAERVELAVKRGDEEWERWQMLPGVEPGMYELFLFDLENPTDYYVEASGVRSSMHHIDVADMPYVQQIDLQYRFPAYSGLSTKLEEDGGDIAALRGTRMTLWIQPTMPVDSGRLMLDGDPIPLMQDSTGRLRASLVVTTPGYYRVELLAIGNRMVPASPDFTIDVLEDQPPSISFSEPGRDTRVTNIEEVFVETKVEDDYGIGVFDLIYSVNGGVEDTVHLFAGGRRVRELTAGHTFYLEELDLEPGDLVSYYATVSDKQRNGGQSATTDIFFMEIRPFRRDYREAEQSGGGGGGGGGEEMGGSLSVQQRQVVSATFKVLRDRASYSDGEFGDNVTTLGLSQGRIRERVDAIYRRMAERGVVQADSAFQKVIDELPKALAAMTEAEEAFNDQNVQDALPPAQRALQHLQRADAAFREVQVGQGQGGGGGGGQSANAEDLADLFELELDKLRNQYESVQRSQQQTVDDEIDETLQQLRELARRQQQENERMRQRAAQMQQSGQAGGGSAAQRRLAEDAEELARKLERLSREQSLPQLEQTARRLQEAADAMKQAASQRSGGLSEGVNALDELREARRLLDGNRSARLERDIEGAQERARRLAQDQNSIADDVQNLSDDPARRREQLGRLVERKEQMAEEISALERDLDQMGREARREQPKAASEIEGAANSIRENRLSEKVRYSRGVIQGRSREYASDFEEQIQQNIEELRDRLDSAAASVGESEEERLGRSLDETRDLVQDLESLRNRIGERSEQGGEQGQQSQSEQPGQREGQEGQQQGQQGQQGQQQGQSGQQGQQQQGGQSGQSGNQGQQQGGGSQGQGFSPAGGESPFSPGRLDASDIRQFRGEFRERREDLEALRNDLSSAGVDTRELGTILRRLQELERDRNFDDPRELERLQEAVIAGLKEFEYGLRRSMGEDEAEGLVLSGSEEVPVGYRDMVEEYYRRLGKNRR